MSGYLVLYVLAVVIGLGFASWFATPKGVQQTSSHFMLFARWESTDALLLQIDKNNGYSIFNLLLPYVGNHIFGSATSAHLYVVSLTLPKHG